MLYINGKPTYANLIVGGTWQANGTWTIPAVTLGGAVTGGGQNITGLGYITFGVTDAIFRSVDNSYLGMFGGADTLSATILLYGKSHATDPGKIKILTPNVALDALVERLNIPGGLATTVATWSNVTHTGLNITSGSSLQYNSVQVVGARVIDARCDDAVNSGDATTDGVIDALRDAMITHGLIAAA